MSERGHGTIPVGIGTKVRNLVTRRGVVLHREPGCDPATVFAGLRPVRTDHELIRLGGEADGGYLVPDDLDGIVACFSPGVDRVATFEQAMLDRGIRTFQIDASVEASPLDHPGNVFERKFLGIETRDELTTLDDWVEGKMGGAEGDLLLQMDIEGAEWLALAQVSERVLSRFRIVVLELHGLDLVVHGAGMLFQPVLDRLAGRFDAVHLHANNAMPLYRSRNYDIAPIVELTLLRKDRSLRREPIARLPHPLDRDCLPDRPSLDVPSWMYA